MATTEHAPCASLRDDAWRLDATCVLDVETPSAVSRWHCSTCGQSAEALLWRIIVKEIPRVFHTKWGLFNEKFIILGAC